MLAARDQENRLFGHSVGGAAGKNHALGPKTPGGKSFNTPMKVPLNDGKSVLRGRQNGGNENLRTLGKGKSNLVTPLARAPLGNKTTNAKAHAAQQSHMQQQKGRVGGVKDIVREIEQSQQQQKTVGPQTGNRRPKAATPRVNPLKLSVLSDDNAQDSKSDYEEDIEYAPPPVAPRPYESDVFPEGVLTFAAFEPQNRLRGVYDHYYNPVDETDGVPLREKAFAEQQRRAFEKLDILVQEDMDSFDWSIGDVPASKEYFANKRKQQQQQQQQQTKTPAPASTQPPATIASRKAASALALSSKTNKPLVTGTALQKKTASSASSISSSLLSSLPLRKPQTTTSALPLRPKSTNLHHPVAEAASRTTLGYNKGRTALSMVRGNNGAPAVRTHTLSTLRSTALSSTTRRAAPTATETTADNVVATPARRPLQMQASLGDMPNDGLEGPSAAPRSPAFVSIFDAQDDENDNLGSAGTFVNDDLDDDFQMDIKF
ncbi:hypothetical protein SPBR_04946 [Sporothrix brasiliensis 5110]|uniref:Uncharacterized protein n=1 Tax=Sporothrix brasiliensis 5110 TaxID=1398154 RepID=A0A0C2F9S8_9PEZI|nr:uncharacterized protein SPBR_04946 [Sporothrix brasiliensis 5110]KIH87848.1 hypothetical protein SPBR_04946 [Sporothrix brasiliensis 5110]